MNGIDLVQDFFVEVDSLNLLKKYLRIAMKTILSSTEEIAIRAVNYTQDNKPPKGAPPILDNKENFPIILIGGSEKYEGFETGNSYFDGYGPWELFTSSEKKKSTNKAIGHIKSLLEQYSDIWMEKYSMTKYFKQGSSEKFDGHYKTGYQLRSCGCFPEVLAICLTNIYYSK